MNKERRNGTPESADPSCRGEPMPDLTSDDPKTRGKGPDYISHAERLPLNSNAETLRALKHLGSALFLRFTHSGDPKEIKNSIRCRRLALVFTSESPAAKSVLLSDLGISYFYRFNRFDDHADLNKAVEYHAQAVLNTPNGHSAKSMRLGNLGVLYSCRFGRLGELADINRAIDCLNQAVLLTPDGDSGKAVALFNLGTSYYSRFWCVNELEDVDKAIGCHSQAILLISNDNASKPTWLVNLGRLLKRRYELSGRVADVHRAIACIFRALALALDTHPVDREVPGGTPGPPSASCSRPPPAVGSPYTSPPGKPDLLGGPAWSDKSRSGRAGLLVDLNKEIEDLDRTVKLIPDGDASKPALLHSLGKIYIYRSYCRGELVDYDKAIKLLNQAVLLTPNGDAAKPEQFNDLGMVYMHRFDSAGRLEDINGAVNCLSQAVLSTAPKHKSRPNWIGDLGDAYHRRFKITRQLEDIGKAVDNLSQAVRLTPTGHENKSYRLLGLGVAYMHQYESTGQLEDIDKAVDFLNQGVLVTPDDHKSKPSGLNNLGASFLRRFERLGLVEDLNRSINCLTQAVRLTPNGHADKFVWLHNLGNSFAALFDSLGKLGDVDRAINYLGEALLLAPEGSDDRPTLLSDLGSAYLRRFHRLEESLDLSKAIDYQHQAVLLTPQSDKDRPRWLSNLANSYISRFGRVRELADLERAIEYQHQAAELIPKGHADWPVLLTNLGSSYHYRFEHRREIADINAAIVYNLLAAKLTPKGHKDRPNWFNKLGISLKNRYKCLDKPDDVDDAIMFQTLAVNLTHDENALKPTFLKNLGETYLCRFWRLGELSDVEAACSVFEEAAQLNVSDPSAQFFSAYYWAKCSWTLDIPPLSAYTKAMELLPQLIWLGTTIHHRLDLLANVELSIEAAALATSMRDYDLAIEWLEEGRCIIWSQLLQLRTPLDNLSAANFALAERLKEVSRELENASSRPAPISSLNHTLDVERKAQYHRRLATEWEQLLTEARRLPGFQDFMRPLKADALRHASRDGPVVCINANHAYSDALIILPNRRSISHVTLENFSSEKAVHARVQLMALTRHRGSRARGFQRLSPRPKSTEVLKRMLATLWSDVVKPVLDFLGYTHKLPIDKLPHITWCTTGALSFLPLHAAGCYDGLQPNAFDLVISSYVPTLKALLSPASVPIPQSGILAVGQQFTRGFSNLPYTVDELAVIKEHAKEIPCMQLHESAATVNAVLDAMDEYSWVHLACHATQNASDPTRSAFRLHDGNLTLASITKRSFKNKGLAFLSACQTAAGDEKLPDEAMHLAAGMLMAGYPSVIATMWAIQDEDAPEVARHVYEDLLKGGKMDCRGTFRALHKAVASLREQVGEDSFERWVPFVHIGV